MIDQVEQTMQNVDEAAGNSALSEEDIRQKTAVLETNISHSVDKGNGIIASMSELLDAYNQQELNELTIRSSAVRFEEAVTFTSFMKLAVKTAGPVCALGLMAALVLLILGQHKADLRREAEAGA